MRIASTFDGFFALAMGHRPKADQQVSYPYQRAIAQGQLPGIVCIPTGCGKTAAIVLGWLWRRLKHPSVEVRSATPRRLVYCLPMRTLVEQTASNARTWTRTLTNEGIIAHDIPVHVLMGGEAQEDWDLYPERDAILVGTQDMLLSRALNRGYATSRARWPMQFGLLNTDCLWIFDEIQLMGAGLATTAQLQAFRLSLGKQGGNGCQSVWMSATMNREWLRTVDFEPVSLGVPVDLTQNDDLKHPEIEKRWIAKKPLARSQCAMGDAANLAEEIRKAHKEGTRTIVVVNTVRRACELYDALNRASRKKRGRAKGQPGDIEPEVVLLHSRFRPSDRQGQFQAALSAPRGAGTIVVSTQVIEAGVDVSATTLFTELAPWTSLVQRFGRCNRSGDDDTKDDTNASVHWLDLPKDRGDAMKLAAPYDPNDLRAAAKRLEGLNDVGLRSLPEVDSPLSHGHVVRRRDLLDLFDTTPDLAGSDIDIDRFVRDIEDSDVRVLWRDWNQPHGSDPPSEEETSPRREELCPAPIGEFRDFVKRNRGRVWRWNFRDKEWEKPSANTITPGQVYLVHERAGGYEPVRGWSPRSTARVDPVAVEIAPGAHRPPDSTGDDPPSRINAWQTIAQHANEVLEELEAIIKTLAVSLISDPEASALRAASRWHDRGKAHAVFQDSIDDGQAVDHKGRSGKRRERPEPWRGCRFVAKAPDKGRYESGAIADPGFWRRYARRHFRHELASALAVLDPTNSLVPDAFRDLVAYLVAAHHGKVRLSIRSLPGEVRPRDDESKPAPQRRFARGVWDGDRLPITDLGDGVSAPEICLSLEPMELGLCEQPPFAGQPSWAERMIGLRDSLGLFHLAYLEAIVRAADMRASRAAEQRRPPDPREESSP